MKIGLRVNWYMKQHPMGDLCQCWALNYWWSESWLFGYYKYKSFVRKINDLRVITNRLH